MLKNPLAISQDKGPCEIHDFHSPATIVNESHHVFPEYLQKRVWGKTLDQRRANLCATGHSSVHYALNYYFKNKKWPANVVGKTRAMAQLAIDRFVAAGGQVP